MIFPVSDLNVFSAAELVLLFGNPEEDWSRSSRFSSDSLTTLPKSNFTCYLASAGTGNQSGPWLQRRQQTNQIPSRRHGLLQQRGAPSILTIVCTTAAALRADTSY